AFETEQDARYHELLWSLSYQIPTCIFKERDGVILQGDYAKKLFDHFDTYTGAEKLVESLDIKLDTPHYTLDAVTRGSSQRVKINLYLCFRHYVAKGRKGQILKNPSILHLVHLETSNSQVIKNIKMHNLSYEKTKKGIRVRFTSADIEKVSEFAKKLAQITGGFIEAKSTIGKLNNVHMPSLIMQAGNLLEGHSIPVLKNNTIFYDPIISIKREEREETIYDLEIDRTHNFIANDIVVHNSIYRWRGAAIANMMQFKSHFPKAKIITLTKNYRSTQTILDSAYQMIQNNNPDRLEIKEKINKKLTTTREMKGEEVELLFGGNAEEEADQILKKIKEEIKNNKRAYSDFAILVRANDHSLPFQRALSHARIPFQFLGPSHLYEQDEIKDLIAYLRVLANFDDTASLYRLLTLPIFDFDAVTIGTILNTAKRKNTSLFETISDADSLPLTNEIKEKIKNLIAMIKRHMEKIPKETAGQILYYFFEDSGLLGYYLDPRTPKTEREALNVAKFFERLQHYASEHDDASIYAVVDWIELSMELGESPMTAEVDWTGINAVNILTIHSSKGLEFPVVFVTNLVTLRFPTRDKKEQIPIPQELIKEELPEGDENVQEERRLFYVAMTRARDKLFLTAAKFYSGGKRERKISPFVYEALGEIYVNTLLKKQQQESASQQLSLLEVLKPVVSKNEEKQEIHIAKNGQSAFIEPIATISYSQLQTFDICPLHYKLRYIMKLPTAPSAALSFGTTMHALLRTIYQLDFHNNPLSPEKINALIDQSFITDGYESREHINDAKKGAKNLLAAFMKENQKEPHVPVETELSFHFLIDNIKIIGRFDRVDRVDEKTIEIIDYKTGRNTPDEKKLKDDLQLTMYALAATEIKNPLFNKTPEHVIVTLYYIEQNKRLTTTRTKEQLEAAKTLILEKVKEIQTSDFHCSGGRLCQNCEYKMLCRV
ncbi:MAG: PD-(D/E)XK nuclease family protein, partial [Candidatus Levybacteria bacterium]|nr:PD-(D/E)XK nuclease family protein [Candidatus Levybacteria bacterium]